MGLRILRRMVPRLALIHIARDVLPLFRQLRPLLGIGRGDVQCQQGPQGIDGHMALLPRLRLAPS